MQDRTDPNVAASAPVDIDAPKGAIPEAGLLGRGIDRIGILFAFAILTSAAILGVEVVLRYVFDAPTIWAHETVIFLNATAFVYGGLYVVSRDAHIRVVLIYDYLSAPWRRIFNVVISLVCLVASIFPLGFLWLVWLRGLVGRHSGGGAAAAASAVAAPAAACVFTILYNFLGFAT